MRDRGKLLRIQALVDDELPDAERREVERWLARDSEARLVADRLRLVSRVIRKGEPVHTLSESREFYWSMIARRLESPKGAAVRTEMEPGWLRRWLWPLTAAGTLGVAALAWFGWPGGASRSPFLALGHEIDTPLSEVSSFTFRSESARMTVVWVDMRLR